jgi:hypothetical protein
MGRDPAPAGIPDGTLHCGESEFEKVRPPVDTTAPIKVVFPSPGLAHAHR